MTNPARELVHQPGAPVGVLRTRLEADDPTHLLTVGCDDAGFLAKTSKPTTRSTS